jgi:hypothetical protein
MNKQQRLDWIKARFREQGKDVYDLSPCCKATQFKGVCMACGKPTTMPWYFVTFAPPDDANLQKLERTARAYTPVGYEGLMVIP